MVNRCRFRAPAVSAYWLPNQLFTLVLVDAPHLHIAVSKPGEQLGADDVVELLVFHPARIDRGFGTAKACVAPGHKLADRFQTIASEGPLASNS